MLAFAALLGLLSAGVVFDMMTSGRRGVPAVAGPRGPEDTEGLWARLTDNSDMPRRNALCQPTVIRVEPKALSAARTLTLIDDFDAEADVIVIDLGGVGLAPVVALRPETAEGAAVLSLDGRDVARIRATRGVPTQATVRLVVPVD